MTKGNQRPGKGEVQVRTYNHVDPSASLNMKQWPNPHDLMGVWNGEDVPPRQTGDERFWQAAVWWALLKKYGHCPKELENPYARVDGEDRFVLNLSDNDIRTICSIWEDQCALAQSSSTITANAEDRDLRELMTTGLSNGRKLQWSFMDCGPAKQFQLHAHPNIEVIYCLRGALHEIRLNGSPVTKTFEPDPESEHLNAVKGPDLTNVGRSWNFATIWEGTFLINEVGSIHKSFSATNGDGCSLLILWGGSHADITKDLEPQTLSVQDALEKMDRKICECVSNKTDVVPETFLPESERSP